MSKTRFQRFIEKVAIDPATRCWIWIGHVNKVSGYGQFWDGEKVVGAHVYSFEHHKGALPEGMEPDHNCKTRKCVCPDHLDPVTRRENLLLGDTIAARNAGKTRCDQGHEFTEQNTYVRANGSRGCRVCRSASNREWANNNRDRRRELDREAYRRKTARGR
jgi:hypothetical protein